MKWLRIGLEIVGALAILAVVVLAVLVYRQSFSDRVNAAGKSDAEFILHAGGITTNQDFQVIASYQSPRSFTGDHQDYYCLELPKFEVDGPMKGEWHDGPEPNPLLSDVLELALNSAAGHISCFPSLQKANSPDMKIFFQKVELHGHFATAADILLYEPQTKRLYYVSFQT